MIIEKLIEVNNFACDNIKALEDAVNNVPVSNAKERANFGNLCVALRGFRMVADATEAMLENEDCLKADDGHFYKKVEHAKFRVPNTSTAGSDYDLDKGK